MSNHRDKSPLPILVILAVVVAWFSPWWAGGRVLAPLDILNEMMQPWRNATTEVQVKNHTVADGVTQYLIYRKVAEESYRREGWMGWSTLKYGGSAEYANTMALYYDWTMQLHRWFDFWTAWHLGILIQVLIAAYGMYFFLRGRSIGTTWAVCGALAFAANSQFTIWIHHRWALGAFCWVPWMLLAGDLHRKGQRGAWCMVPVFTAMALLGGTLQHGAMACLVLGAMWIAEAAGTARWRLGDTQREWARPQLALLGRYSAWGALSLGLAGMMLLPCTAAFLVSNKLGLHTVLNGLNPGGVYPEGPLQPILNAAAYPFQIFPSLFGGAGSLDGLKLFKSKLTYIAYFGSIPVLIAFLACFRRKTPALALALMAAGLLLPLTPLVRYLYQRVYLLFILGGILAFAHFMQNSSCEARRRIARNTAIVAGFAIALWFVASIGFHVKAGAIQNMIESRFLDESGGSAFGFFRTWMVGRFENFTGGLRIWSAHQALPLGLFAGALAGFWWTCSDIPRRARGGALLLAACITAEVTLFAARWVVFADPAKHPAYAATEESRALQEEVGARGRIHTLIKEDGGHMAVTPFVPNTLSAFGLESLRGYDSIVPDGLWLEGVQTSDAATLGRMGVTHLITYPDNPAELPGWELAGKFPTMVLHRNTLAAPRYAGFRSEDELNRFLKGTAVDSEAVALEETTGMSNSRRIIPREGIRWIRIAENEEVGWEYRMSGTNEWKPVRRAADKSMLLELGAPTTDVVEMRYRPPMRMAGFTVSAIALTLLALAQAGDLLRRRTCTEPS